MQPEDVIHEFRSDKELTSYELLSGQLGISTPTIASLYHYTRPMSQATAKKLAGHYGSDAFSIMKYFNSIQPGKKKERQLDKVNNILSQPRYQNQISRK